MSDTIHAALTREEFNDGAGFTYRGVPFIEDEDGRYVYAYGHVDKARFAAAVNDYDREVDDPLVDPYQLDEIQLRYAVTLEPADAPDGWLITWGDDVQDHSDRFPITVVNR